MRVRSRTFVVGGGNTVVTLLDISSGALIGRELFVSRSEGHAETIPGGGVGHTSVGLVDVPALSLAVDAESGGAPGTVSVAGSSAGSVSQSALGHAVEVLVLHEVALVVSGLAPANGAVQTGGVSCQALAQSGFLVGALQGLVVLLVADAGVVGVDGRAGVLVDGARRNVAGVLQAGRGQEGVAVVALVGFGEAGVALFRIKTAAALLVDSVQEAEAGVSNQRNAFA